LRRLARLEERPEERLGLAEAELARPPGHPRKPPLGPELLAAQPGEHRLVAPGRVVGAGRRGPPGGRGRGRGLFGGGAWPVVALAALLRHEVVEELLGLVARDGHGGLRAVAQLRPAPAVTEVDDEPPGADLAEVHLVDLVRLLLAELQGR